MKSTIDVADSLTEKIFNGQCEQFVRQFLRQAHDRFQVEQLARFFTLANKDLYTGQNAWIFQDALSHVVKTNNFERMELLITNAFDFYPIRKNTLLTPKEEEELEQLLYRDYLFTLNKFVKCDVEMCKVDINGCMSITDNDITTNISCTGTDVTITEFKIERQENGYLNTQIGEDLKLPFSDLVKRMSTGDFSNYSETINNAIFIKFAKELKSYRFAVTHLS